MRRSPSQARNHRGKDARVHEEEYKGIVFVVLFFYLPHCINLNNLPQIAFRSLIYSCTCIFVTFYQPHTARDRIPFSDRPITPCHLSLSRLAEQCHTTTRILRGYWQSVLCGSSLTSIYCASMTFQSIKCITLWVLHEINSV